MKISKLINYSIDVCWNGQGTMIFTCTLSKLIYISLNLVLLCKVVLMFCPFSYLGLLWRDNFGWHWVNQVGKLIALICWAQGWLRISNSLCNGFTLYESFKLKTSITRSRTSHLDAYTFMKHAHTSYTHMVLEMLLTYRVKPTKDWMGMWW